MEIERYESIIENLRDSHSQSALELQKNIIRLKVLDNLIQRYEEDPEVAKTIPGNPNKADMDELRMCLRSQQEEIAIKHRALIQLIVFFEPFYKKYKNAPWKQFTTSFEAMLRKKMFFDSAWQSFAKIESSQSDVYYQPAIHKIVLRARDIINKQFHTHESQTIDS